MKGTYNRGVPDTFRATGVRENDGQERCKRLEKEKQKT